MPPMAKGMPTTKASSSSAASASVAPPPPPSQHLLDLIKLREEVVCPGVHPAEPLAVMTDHVTPEVLNSFGAVELAKLDVITSSPFYYIGTLHDKPCYKQESSTDDPAGGLCMFWVESGDDSGWYIAATPFLHLPEAPDDQAC